MIIREWRGYADPAATGANPKHFRETVVPELRRLAGFAGAHLGRRQIAGALAG
jgi:hypothetical protein